MPPALFFTWDQNTIKQVPEETLLTLLDLKHTEMKYTIHGLRQNKKY